MVERGEGGKIVSISSIHGRVAKANMGPYGASKAAIDVFSKQLAVELAPHRINVNVVGLGDDHHGNQPAPVPEHEARGHPEAHRGAPPRAVGRDRAAGGHRAGGHVPGLRRGALHHGRRALRGRRLRGGRNAAASLGRARAVEARRPQDAGPALLRSGQASSTRGKSAQVPECRGAGKKEPAGEQGALGRQGEQECGGGERLERDVSDPLRTDNQYTRRMAVMRKMLLWVGLGMSVMARGRGRTVGTGGCQDRDQDRARWWRWITPRTSAPGRSRS